MKTSSLNALTMALAVMASGAASAQAPGGLSELATLGGVIANARGVSADGAVVVGRASRATGVLSAVRWTAAGGVQDLGISPLKHSEALGVSADGRFIFGVGTFGSRRQSFRWSASTGLERVGVPPAGPSSAPGESEPVAISDDGGVIVGTSRQFQGERRAFRWSASTGSIDLGTFGGNLLFEVRGVSGDGNVVIGTSYTTGSEVRSFRWDASAGFVDLGTLGGTATFARAVNVDGSVIVGSSSTGANVPHAFRWTAATGLVDLGTLGGAASEALHVSADGNAVTGTSTFSPGSARRAFYWTAAQGLVDLGALGGEQSSPRALSADGSTVVGTSTAALGQGLRAFRWSASSGMHELGTFGGPFSTPYAISADGAVVVGDSTDSSATLAFRWELGASVEIGERFCQSAVTNSTGVVGRLAVLGSNALALNDTRLLATQLPPQALGLFVTSLTTDSIPTLGGGLGTLCLGGALGRFAGPGQILNSGTVGSFQLTVDLNALPQPQGAVPAMFGETWNFQAWHRDTVAGAATSNLTDAVGVTYR